MSEHPSLRDVAREAGVSRTTASRALSGQPKVSREAAEAVLAAAEKLNYRADPIARALRSRSSRTVGVIVPVISNPFFAELIDEIEQRLDRHGLELLLADSQASVEQERRKLRMLVERKVDGIVLVPSDHAESAAAITEFLPRTPIIQVDRQVDGRLTDFVGTDNRVGMRLAVEHLTSIGVRDAVLISANDENSVGLARRLLFEEAAADSPLATRPGLFYDFSVEHGRTAAAALLDQGPLPDAIVAGSDIIAFGAISMLTERGVRVPEDIVVVGYDGISFAGIFHPGLTTVEQPVYEIAEVTMRLLLTRWADRTLAPRYHELAPTLLPRRSTARLAAQVG